MANNYRSILQFLSFPYQSYSEQTGVLPTRKNSLIPNDQTYERAKYKSNCVL